MPRTVTVCLTGLLLTACGSPPQPQSVEASDCSYAAVDFANYYETLPDLVEGSREVLIGRIVDETAGPVRRVAVDVRTQHRALTVEVEEVFKGDPPARFELAVFDWTVEPDGSRSNDHCPYFNVGDRAFLALTHGPDGERGGGSAVSEYRLIDGQVLDTDRGEPLARRIESMTEQELAAAVREAR